MRRLILSLVFLLTACGLATQVQAQDGWIGGPGYRTFLIGDESKPTQEATKGGLLLSGGGDWAPDAFKWFVAQAGHGHIVVLRASGSTEANDSFYNEVGGVLSVRTFLITNRKAASDPRLVAAVRSADGVFFAGGDQSNYVRMWRGTPLNDALDADHVAGKPIGGTSAGLAVLGVYLYGAMDGGSIDAPTALADPLGKAVTVEGNFFHFDLLDHIFTDSHFDTRSRLGRLIAFLAKAQTMTQTPLTGLGIDESSALAVEADGTAHLSCASGGCQAWLVQNGQGTPVLKHKLDMTGIHVIGIGINSGFNIKTQSVTNPAFVRTYDVKDGVLSQEMHYALAIHGGAGIIERANMTPDKDAAYRQGLNDAMAAGQAVLAKGGTAVDAVQATLVVLEDNPLFNAGKGADIAADNKIYLDAAIMDGSNLKAGAVAGITKTKNPILLARAVMDKTRHVMLAGDGADAFSVQQGLTQVDNDYFRTPEREQMFADWQKEHPASLDCQAPSGRAVQATCPGVDATHMYGTVGAVALDADGHLAAATSTGGLTGKQWGRIGDSPIIGAGTYARDGDCAVSATGTGEYFIRDSAARQVCDRVRWNHETIDDAAHDTIMSVGSIGGDGGLIAMDASGHASFAINDLGMYRGFVSDLQPAITAIYVDEDLH